MIQHNSFELSRSELLQAVTTAIKEEYRYAYTGLAPGEALDISPSTDGSYFVKWGEIPEPEPEPVITDPTACPTCVSQS